VGSLDDLRPEVAAVEARLARVYRSAQRVIDAELERLSSDPTLWRRRGRLIAMQRRIAIMLRQVDQQAAAWLNRDLPRIYQMGAADGAVLAGVFTQVNRAAVSRLAHDTMVDLLAATRHVDADVKRLVRRVAAEAVALKVTTGRPAKAAARSMARAIEEEGVAAVVYRDGSRVGLDTYAEMVVRTKSALAYSQGTLDGAPEVSWWQIIDGPGCHLVTHDSGPLANGLLVPRALAQAHPIAHPRCRRGLAPRPDVTSSVAAAAAQVRSTEAIRRQLAGVSAG
jgi:hypothetical protein